MTDNRARCLFFTFFLSIVLWLPCSAQENRDDLGTVIDTWGKKVVKIQFKDPSRVKTKDIYYLYRDGKAVGKVQVYEIKKEVTWATLIEDTGPAATGDMVRKEGEISAGQPIDLESYDRLVFPIFVDTCTYAYGFISTLANLQDSVINKNDPNAVKKFNESVKKPGSEGWLFYISQLQKAFIDPSAKKMLYEGDTFFSQSIDRLKAVRPPDALINPHKRLIGLLGHLRVVFNGFKQVPEGQGTEDMNTIVGIHNRFIASRGSLTKYNQEIVKLLSDVIDEYLEFFPEWKDKDPRAKYQKTI